MSEVNKDEASVLTKKPEVKDLSISCVDEIGVKARMTFDDEIIEGSDDNSIHITYWLDDDQNIEAQVSRIFAALFEEVVKTKDIGAEEIAHFINQ